MQKNVFSFISTEDWEKPKDYTSIENDIILFERRHEKHHVNFVLNRPFKVDVIITMVCLRGTLKGSVNMRSYTSQSPCFILVQPNQILQQEFVSEDFEGFFVIFSQRFAGMLLSQIEDKFPLFISSINRTVMPLKSEHLSALKVYYRTMKRVIAATQSPYRLEIAKHLTMSLFYSFGSWFHDMPEQTLSKQGMFVKKFLKLVQTHCKEERGLNFYADKLCITSKHLSKVIKENSNMSAVEWIDNSVVLEAQAMLKSTNMTIQQISDELNFPSQSFFGKFFKRITGLSPKVYQKV